MQMKLQIKSKKIWMTVVRDGFILLLIVYGVSLYQTRNIPESVPEFQAQLITGESVDIKKMLKQSPVIIYFWGSWCPLCSFTSSTISDLSKNYPVLTIALSSGNKQEVLKYLQKNGYKFATINDPDGEISKTWNVGVTPTIFIINTQGEISSAMVGISSSWGIKLRYWFDSILTIY